MIQAELIQLAYSMYPRNINYDDERYKMSLQYQHLQNRIKNATGVNFFWNTMISEFSKSEIAIVEIGPGYETSKSYHIGFDILAKPNRILVLTVSKLVPYYCFYSSRNVSWKDHKCSFEFISWSECEELNQIRSIKPYLRTIFPDYKELLPEYLNIVVPDIMDEDLGFVDENTHGVLYKNMTIFGAFFNVFVYY